MKLVSLGVLLLTAAGLVSGCAKDNLDPLHLVSTEEISVQKRQTTSAPAAAGEAVKSETSAAAPEVKAAEAASAAVTPPAAQ